MPYRAAPHARPALAPSLRWTRPAAFVLTALGAVVPVVSVYELLADHECSGEATPHVAAAILVVLLTAALLGGAVWLRRRVARWVSRTARATSRLAGIGWAATTLVPLLVLGFAGTAAAAWIDFDYTFHICVDFGDVRPLLSALFHC